jgi:hypothetical protein
MDVQNWVVLFFGRLLLNAEAERLQLLARIAELEADAVPKNEE